MILSLLIIIISLLLGLTFIVGLILFVIGRLKKEKNNKLTKMGVRIASVPTSIFIFLLLIDFGGELFSSKPDEDDLIGTYQIVKVTNLDIDKSKFNNYKLQFTENGRFTLTPTPFIKVCESGKYQVDYNSDYNELSFECPTSGFSSAHIDRGFGNYKIEFTIGDPDSEESIYFEKIKD